MEKIKYYYTSMSKQVFLITLALLLIARSIVFIEVIFFNINNYPTTYNLSVALFIHFVYLLITIFFFFGHKYFIAEYDENNIVYTNKILRRKNKVELKDIQKAVLGKRGISLYTSPQKKPCFFLPFFRLGVVSPVGVDGFYKILKSKDILLEKKFTILPGHGKYKKIFSVLYSCLALFTLAYLTQALALIFAIIKNR